MMATAAVIGLSAGKRLLSTSFIPSDVDRLFAASDHGSVQFSASSNRNTIVAHKSSHFGTNAPSYKKAQVIRALKEHLHTSATTSVTDEPDQVLDDDAGLETSLEVVVLLHKSMLEKQWKLPFDEDEMGTAPVEDDHKDEVIRSGISARQRRTTITRGKLSTVPSSKGKRRLYTVSPELLQARHRGYLWGMVKESVLSHAEVVHLSKKIKAGRLIEEHRSKLKEKMEVEPSDKQLARSLKIPLAELHSKMFECSLAREKLLMSNVRLVMSIAQRYDNLGADMSDLIQAGLIGLLRGIEKFDPSKGFKISTYVYWWIRQGISRTLVRHSRTLRLPSHLYERLSSIRYAKLKLEEQGITPTTDKIAEYLNMSAKKIQNATEWSEQLAPCRVFSLDREAFASLDGLPGETFHSYIDDRNPANDPWHGFEEWCVKDEVNKLLHSALNKREREIIRRYHGLGYDCHTWEDISGQFGLSRERVRQLGLVAMEKLKNAARKRRLEAMLVKQ